MSKADFELDAWEWVKKIRASAGLLVLVTIGTMLLSLLIAKVFIPTRYKAFSVISIPSSYFQHPGADDMITPINDGTEMRALRESLVKTSLSREFFEKLRIQFNLFEDAATMGEEKYESAMQKLSTQFEILPLGVTSFQINVLGSSPEQALSMANETQKSVVDRLAQLRQKELQDLRDNLIGRVDNLAFSVNHVGDPISNSRPEVLQKELGQIRGILNSLKARFSSEHPLVKSYQQREALILKWLNDQKVAPIAKSGNEKIQGLASASLVDMDRYGDLLKRLDKLNIVIEFETQNPSQAIEVTTPPVRPLSPVSPNLKLISLWGALLGILIAVLNIAFQSLKQAAASPQAAWAIENQIPYLGRMPRLERELSEEGIPAASGPPISL